MKHLVILGAGTAGTIIANRLSRHLRRDAWKITVVDPDDRHYYQPGFVLLPFGEFGSHDVVRPRTDYLPDRVTFVHGQVERVVAASRTVVLAGGVPVSYDYLVIATGMRPRPDLTPGLLDGGQWRRTIFDVHSYAGAVALGAALKSFSGGRLVVHPVEPDVKGPFALLEFILRADSYFRERGLRGRVELVYATPAPAAPLPDLLGERGIACRADFGLGRVEGTALVAADERWLPFDLLVTAPIHRGANYVARSGLGDARNLVPAELHSLRSKVDPEIFVVGDAASLPAAKGGSVAAFAADVFVRNFVELAHGRPADRRFDGHANFFVETGADKAMLLDFNCYSEPLPGNYPSPILGPFRLLKETRNNYRGVRMAKWLYWNRLLRGRRVPLPSHLDLAGKRLAA